jgi:hypothetical protein
MDGLVTDDIRWVLTVPAISNDGAKQFMREAAEKVSLLLYVSVLSYILLEICHVSAGAII